MSHFARVENGIVRQVIVAEQDVIDSGVVGDPSIWIQTSYNTRAGEHLLGGTPLRKNYAGIGMIYDSQKDAFYSPKIDNTTWIFNEHKCVWERPIPYPTDGKSYNWNESAQTWVEQ
jgi:hypothetical protein